MISFKQQNLDMNEIPAFFQSWPSVPGPCACQARALLLSLVPNLVITLTSKRWIKRRSTSLSLSQVCCGSKRYLDNMHYLCFNTNFRTQTILSTSKIYVFQLERQYSQNSFCNKRNMTHQARVSHVPAVLALGRLRQETRLSTGVPAAWGNNKQQQDCLSNNAASPHPTPPNSTP